MEVFVTIPTDGTTSLPPVCIACGRSGRWNRRVRVPGESSGYARMVGEYALDNLERMARGPGVIRLPVCWWHKWVVPPVVALEARGSAVRLSGVSAEFAAAVGHGHKSAEPGATADGGA